MSHGEKRLKFLKEISFVFLLKTSSDKKKKLEWLMHTICIPRTVLSSVKRGEQDWRGKDKINRDRFYLKADTLASPMCLPKASLNSTLFTPPYLISHPIHESASTRITYYNIEFFLISLLFYNFIVCVTTGHK